MSPAGPATARSRVLVGVYLTLSVIGLVGTWWFNLSFAAAAGGGSYLGGWFANDASSSAAVDIIVAGVAACVLMVVEGRRLGWGVVRIAALVVLSVVIAVAFTFPLFLALREQDRTATGSPSTRTPRSRGTVPDRASAAPG